MFEIQIIQSGIYGALSKLASIPVYFYPPLKSPETYAQINAVKIVEGPNYGDGLAELEINIQIKSENKSSLQCLRAMDEICSLSQKGEIKPDNFIVHSIGELERILMINKEQKWIGDITFSFWIELAQ